MRYPYENTYDNANKLSFRSHKLDASIVSATNVSVLDLFGTDKVVFRRGC